ncbi:hypothetical protein [Geothrix sp. PMB-07]|uniref:hypothetical protein n=1 Tax=Geothrix sp. PMB-07 TaxID=3068640 RepID=UPI0027428EB6|nr:hypothetical protein [Geothrix sp. PMB-07]WLT31666.1 hypothetical protein Q9293_18340 [Geothrix sp. PMB-07]
MQRHWVMALIVASGLLAQTPPQEPPATPVQVPAPETKPAEAVQEPPVAPQATEPKAAEPKAFDQLRPTQRKLAYTLHRAALSAHELGYYRSHPRALEVREALEALVKAKLDIPEKASAALAPVEAYLAKFNANHGLYDAEGKKLLLESTWKDLQTAARAAAKTGPKGLEPRLAKIKGLLLDAKVDATAPSWAEPETPAKGKKKAKAVKGPKAPEGFAGQKAITALWVKRAQAWVENTTQEVEVKGEKKTRRLPDPVQVKALNDLSAWLEKDDLELLRDPGFGWLDVRRLSGGATLLTKAADIVGSKAPEGPAPELVPLPTFEPVLGDSKFSKGEDKRAVLADVKQGPAPASLADQAALFQKLGRSRDYDVK